MKRIDSIDIAKGILIILVVVAHVFQSGYVHDLIYSFHMPAFFIISGMLLRYKNTTQKPMCDLLKSRLRSIAVPFCFFEIYGCVTNILRFGFAQNIKGYIYNTLTCHFNNGVNWFLFSLFWSEIIFLICAKACRNRYWLLLAISSLLFVVGLYTPSTNSMLYSFRQAITCCLLLCIGYLSMRFLLDPSVFLALICSLIVVAYPFVFSATNMSGMEFANPLSFLLGSMCGTYLLMFIGKNIKSKYLTLIGKNTIVIFGTHNFFYIVFGHALGIADFHYSPLLTGIMVCILVLLVEIPIVFMINRYFPFLVGRKNHPE